MDVDGCEWMDGLDDPYQSYPTLLNQIYSMIYTISMPFIIVSRPIPRRYRALLSNYARYVYHDIECQHWFAWILRGHKNLEQCGEWTSGRCHFSDSTSASIENTVVHLYLKINFTRSFNNEMQTNSRLTLKLCDLDRDPNINHI